MGRGHAILRNEVRAHDARAPADALAAVDEHAGGGVAERVGDERGRGGEMGDELRKGEIVERDLGVVQRELGREGDEARHDGEDVGDREGGEHGRVLGHGEVGYEQSGQDLGDGLGQGAEMPGFRPWLHDEGAQSWGDVLRPRR